MTGFRRPSSPTAEVGRRRRPENQGQVGQCRGDQRHVSDGEEGLGSQPRRRTLDEQGRRGQQQAAAHQLPGRRADDVHVVAPAPRQPVADGRHHHRADRGRDAERIGAHGACGQHRDDAEHAERGADESGARRVLAEEWSGHQP
ncbi:MAG: hypothetical protein B7X40_07200 [Cellulomonas sp. 14-74-6]|nr:MAG: hypothetical protein B7X40_07200 [Cellulomonas sp. 14-74-6]